MVLIIASVGALAYVTGRLLTGQPLFDEMLIEYGIPEALITELDATEAEQDTELQEDTLLEEEIVNLWNMSAPVASTLSYETVGVDDRLFALPQNGKVSLDFFTTAMFVGDSLSQGFDVYASSLDITPIAAAFKGATPQGFVENRTAEIRTGTSLAMWDHVVAQTPDTIYVCIGANALVATDDDAAFLHYYGQMLDALRTQFPTLPIYVMAIPPVTDWAEAARSRLANSRIDSLNDAISLMSIERGMYYLNIQEVLEDENGYLREDIASSNDGLHLKDSTGYTEWLDYLATHTAYSPFNAQFLIEPYGA